MHPSGIQHRQRILVVGCGALGGQTARALAAAGHEVWGLRRDAARVPPPLRAIGADLLDRERLAEGLPDAIDQVLYCLTPSQMDAQGYQAVYEQGLANLLQAGMLRGWHLQRLWFVSSTSVYAQNDDSAVDERSPCQPSRFAGQSLLAGEQLALQGPWPASVVRFSGIYGGARTRFLHQVLSGQVPTEGPSPYTNRIHEADAIGALCHLMTQVARQQAVAPLYLASDDEPVRQHAVSAWIRTEAGLPPVPRTGTEPPQGQRGGSKRCLNHCLRASGYVLRYPTFREGYGEMLASAST